MKNFLALFALVALATSSHILAASSVNNPPPPGLSPVAVTLPSDFAIDGTSATPVPIPGMSFTLAPGKMAIVMWSIDATLPGSSSTGAELFLNSEDIGGWNAPYGAMNGNISRAFRIVSNTTGSPITVTLKVAPNATPGVGLTGVIKANSCFFSIPVQ